MDKEELKMRVKEEWAELSAEVQAYLDKNGRWKRVYWFFGGLILGLMAGIYIGSL